MAEIDKKFMKSGDICWMINMSPTSNTYWFSDPPKKPIEVVITEIPYSDFNNYKQTNLLPSYKRGLLGYQENGIIARDMKGNIQFLEFHGKVRFFGTYEEALGEYKRAIYEQLDCLQENYEKSRKVLTNLL